MLKPELDELSLFVHVDVINILTQETFLCHFNNMFLVSLASISTRSTSYMSGSFIRKPPRQISLLRHWRSEKKGWGGRKRKNKQTQVGLEFLLPTNRSDWEASCPHLLISRIFLCRNLHCVSWFLCKVQPKWIAHAVSFHFCGVDFRRVLFRESRGRVGGFNYPVRGQDMMHPQKNTLAHTNMLESWEGTFAIETAPVKGRTMGNQLDLFLISHLLFISAS